MEGVWTAHTEREKKSGMIVGKNKQVLQSYIKGEAVKWNISVLTIIIIINKTCIQNFT